MKSYAGRKICRGLKLEEPGPQAIFWFAGPVQVDRSGDFDGRVYLLFAFVPPLFFWLLT